jgi:hypothetical protein
MFDMDNTLLCYNDNKYFEQNDKKNLKTKQTQIQKNSNKKQSKSKKDIQSKDILKFNNFNRVIIENVFARLDKFFRINIRRERKVINTEGFHLLAFSYMIFNHTN